LRNWQRNMTFPMGATNYSRPSDTEQLSLNPNSPLQQRMHCTL